MTDYLELVSCSTVSSSSSSFKDLGETNTPTTVRVRGDSPYSIVGLQRAQRRVTTVGSAFLDVKVAKDFDPKIALIPEKIVNVTAMVRFLNDKPEGIIRDYIKAGTKICNWVAKTGLGKTTKFPFLLLKASGSARILVIEPSIDIAKNVFRYLRSRGVENVALWSLTEFSGQFEGIIYCDGGTAASAVVNDPSALEGFDYVILDEAHETSGVYYALRVLLAAMKGTTDIIFMSATLDGCDDQNIDSKFSTAMTKLRAVNCTNFVSSAGAEDVWHYRNIIGRVLILVDTDDRCNDIAKWYNDHGITAMRYGWDIGPLEYSKIFEQLTKDAGRNVVVVSTCAARTGVTLPIDSVIDLRSTMDYNYDYQSRLLTSFTRTLTLSEAKQGVGRVGRMSSGRAYVVPQEFVKFPFGVRASHRLYACLWLICMGYDPSPDVFPNERNFLGNLPRLGAAQLLNLYLHPAQARFYVNEEGLFYKNFDIAVRHYMVLGAKARLSDKVLELAGCGWYKHNVSLACLNDGLTVTLHLPNDPAGINNAELLDCAVMELQWRNNRGPFDYATAVTSYVPKTKYVPQDRAPSYKPVEEERKLVVRDKKEEVSAAKVVQDAAQSTDVIPYVPRRSFSAPVLDRFDRMSKFIQLPDITNTDTYGGMASRFAGVRSFVMVQPVIPYDKTRDFLFCTHGDEILIQALVDEETMLSNIDASSRRRYHDSFCAVWNKTKAKERFLRDTAGVSRRVRNIFRKRDRDNEAVDAGIDLDTLYVLDAQFRMYGMFVEEATRYLTQHSDVVFTHCLPIYRVHVAGINTGFGVVLGNKFFTLDHVCGNVPIWCKCDTAGDFSAELLGAWGMISVYSSPVVHNIPYRHIVDGESVYVHKYVFGRYIRAGPYLSTKYDSSQFVYAGYSSSPGDSGSVITGSDGMVLGLHVGVLNGGNSVGYCLADFVQHGL